MRNIHTVVSGPAEVTATIFNPKFLSAWVLAPFVNGADNEDDFGLYIAGGEL